MIKVRKFYKFKKWLKIRLFKMNEFPFVINCTSYDSIVLYFIFWITQNTIEPPKFWRLVKKVVWTFKKILEQKNEILLRDIILKNVQNGGRCSTK